MEEDQIKRTVKIAEGIFIFRGIRFELRLDGLHVQRPRHKESVLSFEQALDAAEGQYNFWVPGN